MLSIQRLVFICVIFNFCGLFADTCEFVFKGENRIDLFSSQFVSSHSPSSNLKKSSDFFSQLEKTNIRRDIYNSHYIYAKNFILDHGENFANLVFGKIKKEEKVKVLIMMGGAEFFSYYLQAVVKRDHIENLDIIDLYLTKKIFGHWRGLRSIKDSLKWQIGFGKKIETSVLDRKRHVKGNNSEEEIRAYIVEQKVFENTDKIIVVDTGFLGTTLEVMNQIVKSQALNIEVEGVLLHHRVLSEIKNTFPIRSLNKGRDSSFNHIEGGTDWWAFLIDHGQAFDRIGFSSDLAFQRSRPSPSQLVRGRGGRWEPNTQPYRDELKIKNFQSMLLAIQDRVFDEEP